jgi:hypothetical protein
VKKILVLCLVIAVIFMSGCINITKQITEAREENVEFFFKIEGTKDGEIINDVVSIEIPAGQTSYTQGFYYGQRVSAGYDVTITEIDIPSGWELKSSSGDTEFYYDGDIVGSKNVTFINARIGLSPADKKSKADKQEEEPAPWVRDKEFQCWQVWVNEQNKFEFVFVWEYKDNNHVQILDNDGNIVFYIDLPKGNCHFVADLPDGTYTVQNYHEAGHILREFVIGKP